MTLTRALTRALHASYCSFLAAVDAEAKAGEGRMAGGMSQSQAPVVAPQVGTVLGEMSRGSQQDSLPSGIFNFFLHTHTHTHLHTHTHALTYIRTHTHSLPLSLSHTHTTHTNIPRLAFTFYYCKY
jgi:hypothetical protein